MNLNDRIKAAGLKAFTETLLYCARPTYSHSQIEDGYNAAMEQCLPVIESQRGLIKEARKIIKRGGYRFKGEMTDWLNKTQEYSDE